MIIISAGHFPRGFRSRNNSRGDDIGVGFGDAIFLQFAGDDRLDLMFQAERGEGHGLGGDGGVDLVAVGGEEAG